MTHAWARAAVGGSITTSFLSGAGLVAAATAVFVVLTGTRFVGAPVVGGYVEFLMLGVPAAGLLYAGYWLRDAGFDPEAVWRVGAFSVAGTLVAAVATGVGLLAVTGPGLGAGPTFALLVSTGTEGALLGVLVGTFAVTDRLFRRERAAADEYETLHALLRHDVRNRLTIIGGHLTRLAEATNGPGDAVGTIETQLDAIEGLLEDTRVATAALRDRSALEPVDLVAVVRNQLSLLEESYDGVAVSADLPDRATVAADDLLGAVLDNLFTNAVVHADAPTAELAVTVTGDPGQVRLAVADNGPGIPADRREAVFEPGVGDGTGMGLYLVRTVVERYGGTVAIDDNQPRGTVVTVTLPRADGGR